MTKIVLIGGYPKGFEEPFHIKTRSGRILHKIVDNLKIKPTFFDLWKNIDEENARTLSNITTRTLRKLVANDYKLIALGRYIEKVLIKNKFVCVYLPHPASREKKFLTRLQNGLKKYKVR